MGSIRACVTCSSDCYTMACVVWLVTRHSGSHVMQGDHRWQVAAKEHALKCWFESRTILSCCMSTGVMYTVPPRLYRLLWSCRSCSWPQNRLPCCPQSSGRASSSSKSRFRRQQEHLDSPPRKNLRRFSGEPRSCRKFTEALLILAWSNSVVSDTWRALLCRTPPRLPFCSNRPEHLSLVWNII